MSKKVMANSSKVDYSVMKNANLSKETIGEWLDNDLQTLFVFVCDVMHTKEIRDALVDVLYARYKALHAQKEAAPELPLEEVQEGGKND